MSQTDTAGMSPADISTGASFDVHGLVAVRVEPGTPGEAQLRDMLAPFLGDSRAPLQLQVRGNITGVQGQSHAEDAYRYTSDTLYLPGDKVQVVQTDDGYRVEGRGELLTAVIPLLDRLCVREKTAMVHAAIVDYRGAGVLLPAWGGVGKTSTVAKLVAMPGVRFMADDWGFLTGDGDLLGYAKPMFIKPHHRAIYPELFQGARKPLAPGWLTTPVSHLATTVHPVIVRYPRTADFTRRWSPEHRMVHPDQVFGTDRIATRAPLRLAMFLERYDGTEALLEQRSSRMDDLPDDRQLPHRTPHGLPPPHRGPWLHRSGADPGALRTEGRRRRPGPGNGALLRAADTGELVGGPHVRLRHPDRAQHAGPRAVRRGGRNGAATGS